jgi:hypothetical protein
MHKLTKDITGQVFTDLTVVRYLGNSFWETRCVCGRLTKNTGTQLRAGKIKSCGCTRSARRKPFPSTHGMSKSRLYMTWRKMLDRCYNRNENSYPYYGGRGILVEYEAWKKFVPFKDWALQNGYRDDLTINRKDNDKGYYPENCNFITLSQQFLNRRSNHILSAFGESKTITEWSADERCCVSRGTIGLRLRRGWSVEMAITLPSIPVSVSCVAAGHFRRWRPYHSIARHG